MHERKLFDELTEKYWTSHAVYNLSAVYTQLRSFDAILFGECQLKSVDWKSVGKMRWE